MTECIFCDIISGKIESSKVYEDDRVLALMDIQPVNQGHILIIPKKHAKLMTDLDDDLISHIFKIAKKINIALRKSGVKCEGVNIFLADGEAAFQEIFHVHVHVIPRFAGDGFELVFSPKYFKKPSREELDRISEKIKSKTF
jgi:histidine triad (HIT) family protein